jgi:hypothetical protein
MLIKNRGEWIIRMMKYFSYSGKIPGELTRVGWISGRIVPVPTAP